MCDINLVGNKTMAQKFRELSTVQAFEAYVH